MDFKDHLQLLNRLRRQTEMKLVIFYISIALLILLTISLVGTIIPAEIGQMVIFIIAFLVIVSVFIHQLIVKKYKTTFKTMVIPESLKQFGDKITYELEGLSKADAEKTKMFGHFSTFESEDTVKGKLEAVEFKCSDVKLGYYTGGKHRRYVPVCHGQFYIFDFNKRFKTNTIIREVNRWKPSGFKRVDLENVEFNKKFNVFSTNEHDAFYILTPHFMERLIAFEQEYHGVLFMSFHHNQLYIGIHNNKNRFEPPLFSVITENIYKTQTKEINIIKDIILDLKLNEKIFIE